MRAVICRQLTGIDGLSLVEDWPEPAAGPGEVLIDVRSAALNFQRSPTSGPRSRPSLGGELAAR